MVKKVLNNILVIFSFFLVLCCLFTGCSSDDEQTEEQTYNIVYEFDGAVYTIEVKHGELWYMDSIPSKEGYVFTGLYDAESGGEKYASSYGMCVTAFYDDKNIVLYPQFSATQFTLNLNYGESSGTTTSVTADYDGEIPDLPANLVVSGKSYMVFSGWYTEENCGGIKVADSEGNCLVSMDSSMRKLSTSDNIIQLYAGFSLQTYTVTFYNESGSEVLYTTSAEYGTDVSSIGSDIETNGKYVSTWSLYRYGNVAYSGIVDDDLNLYAISYCFKITFNTNGGNSISAITVDEGDSAVLPTSATRTGYTFAGWYDSSGTEYSGEITPSNNMTLTAKWTANTYNVTLNANGGTVTTSSYTVTYGNSYKFAVPEMEGYFFNGWYYGNTKISDGSGKISSWSIASNVTLTAKWSQYEDYTVSLTRESCKKDNGYNPSTAGTSLDLSEHKTFEFLDLVVSGCAMDSYGNYYVPYGSELKLSFEVLQNPGSLPVHTLDGASVNWTVHNLSNDDYTGEVYGTNISGEKIGYGAYYIKVTYTDGTYTESNKVNFLSGASKGSLVEATLDINSNETIKKIEVVAVYELYYNYMSNIWDWDGTACYSNWRLSTMLNFTTSK